MCPNQSIKRSNFFYSFNKNLRWICKNKKHLPIVIEKQTIKDTVAAAKLIALLWLSKTDILKNCDHLF